ncbi:hypothetical protein SALBM135S_04795 [Streptomyces alboniger]
MECITSGWYCTPYSFFSSSSKAATGTTSVDAVTVKPSGAALHASPCDIHTGCSAGVPSKRVESALETESGVRPYSRAPVLSTVPPRVVAISWKP